MLISKKILFQGFCVGLTMSLFSIQSFSGEKKDDRRKPAELKVFKTDGCSLYPEGKGKRGVEWLHCCFSHDLLYYQGGTKLEKFKADLKLAECVAVADDVSNAYRMLSGVHAGGSPNLPMPWRWGYGWPKGRGYKSVTPEERSEVVKRLKAYNCEDSLDALAKDKNWNVEGDVLEKSCVGVEKFIR